MELKEFYSDFDNKDLIKFKLKISSNIIDMSHMFDTCKNLISIKIIENLSEINIISIESNNNKQVNNKEEDFTLDNDSYISYSLLSLSDKEKITIFKDTIDSQKGIYRSISSVPKTSNSIFFNKKELY